MSPEEYTSPRSRHISERSDVIRCPRCDTILGQFNAGMVIARHKKREYSGFPISIGCDRCGGIWYTSLPDLIAMLEHLLGRLQSEGVQGGCTEAQLETT